MIRCNCGNSSLTADFTVFLGGVPFTLSQDGPQYDDSEAAYSEGWDYNNQNRCRCQSCGMEYEIVTGNKANLFLQPVSAPRATGPAERRTEAKN